LLIFVFWILLLIFIDCQFFGGNGLELSLFYCEDLVNISFSETVFSNIYYDGSEPTWFVFVGNNYNTYMTLSNCTFENGSGLSLWVG
jgi:hypothetical protein